MERTIISLILLSTLAAPALAASSGDLLETAPDTYTVVRGDTLWSISGRFLKEPWRWPELWKMNQEQIKNPHLIYPGDVIVLDRSARDMQLRMKQLETVRLSPKVRSEPLAAKAVPTISPAVIEPFLSKPLVVGEDELASAPRLVAGRDARVAFGAGDVAYAVGLAKDRGAAWQIFRRGDPLVDPETNELLGYEALYLGEARVREFGADVSTVDIVKSTQEIYRGDTLLPASKEIPTFAYVPHAPAKNVRGRIVSTYGSLLETGAKAIVALSKGSKDGLEVGHVLAIYPNQRARVATRTSPLYGRSGLSGDDAPRTYYEQLLTPRDGPIYPISRPVDAGDADRLPAERSGLVMVFRTFDRTAFGLVMEASRQVSLYDVVANP